MLFTLFILLLYRIGAAIPVPFVTATSLKVAELGGSGSIFSYLNILSGDSFSKGTLFALAVSPYITAQIVIQLLAVAIPALEKLSKQGEEGRKKIERITRYLTVALALITAFGYYSLLASPKMTQYYGEVVTAGANKFETYFIAVTIILCYTAGASLIMWLAEKIDEQGIGNGISMILFANILCGVPSTIANFKMQIEEYLKKDNSYVAVAVVLSVLAILVVLASIVFMVYMTDAERRIPVQYAKRVVGRKMYGGQNSNLPIKLNMSGVMPIIFATTIVSLPITIIALVEQYKGSLSKFGTALQDALSSDNWIYAVVLFVLIIAFAYFYISISFNPVEVANNLMQQGGSIPGIRPGKPTAQYIQKVLNKVVLMGAFFLGIIACVPLVINIISTEIFSVGIGVVSFSGNSLLIVVGVALETVRDMESQMAMRHYKGFLQ